MAFDRLTGRLSDTFRKLSGKANLTKENIADALAEIRVALLEADVNLAVINELLNHVQDEVLGMDVTRGVDPSQMFVKVVYDKLVEILGAETALVDLSHQPTVMMLVGLQGSGKTTSAAKIARHIMRTENKKVLLVAADRQRPAAIEQLQILGEQIGADVFTMASSSALEVVQEALTKKQNYDLVLIDTAGRLQIDQVLMQELKDIEKLAKPHEILLSVDAMSGQDVIHVAQGFNDALTLTGLVATKFDGDARGGSVLSVRHLTGVPVKYVGMGETLEDLELFHADRIASRILGMGDIVSLVEKAQEKMDVEAAEASAKRMLEGTFTLDDMLIQMKQMSRMGPLSGLMKMLPGQMGQMANQVNDQEAAGGMKKTVAIISSMTKEERAKPEIIRASRKKRIAQGSGTTTTDVNRLLSQFEKMKKQMRVMSRMMRQG